MGMGDEVMASGHARRLHQQTGKRVVIVDRDRRPRWSEVWDHNPIIARERADDTVDLQHAPGVRPYLTGWDARTRTWSFNHDYRAVDLVGEIWLTPDERKRAAALVPAPFVLIEPNINPKNSVNKQWGADKWQQLVDGLPQIRWLQLDTGGPVKLQGVAMAKVPTYRDACAVLDRAQFYVGPEGGLHHAAAALGKRAVVIFGGFVSPRTTGYDTHINIVGDPVACGRMNYCGHCERAMQNIAVETVTAAVLKLAAATS